MYVLVSTGMGSRTFVDTHTHTHVFMCTFAQVFNFFATLSCLLLFKALPLAGVATWMRLKHGARACVLNYAENGCASLFSATTN